MTLSRIFSTLHIPHKSSGRATTLPWRLLSASPRSPPRTPASPRKTLSSSDLARSRGPMGRRTATAISAALAAQHQGLLYGRAWSKGCLVPLSRTDLTRSALPTRRVTRGRACNRTLSTLRTSRSPRRRRERSADRLFLKG